ncbi:hypothetical protein B296_00056988 [Ensete ventricosum]|uniref:Uncharacterized protein n=1 Tax=Ensete ventricosum TaxID=4639 RepID=A0A426X4I7_ENSVE|nr:hypothetical protein B296_00056988 [Ensete ventricosum]
MENCSMCSCCISIAKAARNGVACHRQAPCRGCQPWPKPLTREASPRPGSKGWLPVARPQGAAPLPGLSPARVAPGKSGYPHR